MRPLSGLDATFLYLESDEQPMHVGSLHLYELPEDFEGSFTEAVRRHIASRLHLAPVFSRRLQFMPFDVGHPVWLENQAVDVADHIVHVRMKAGATVQDVQAKCAQLHGELIDRSGPLWVFYCFDRIKAAPGDLPPSETPHAKRRIAGFYSKIHHATLDGKAGTVLANAILDLGPVPREVPPPDPARKPRSGSLKVGEMIGAVFSNSLAQYAKLAKSLPGAASSVGSALNQATKSNAGGKRQLKLPVSLAPKTVFNTAITADRAFSTASVPFAPCREMAKAIGASFNDVVLWLCATALRGYLDKHGGVPSKSLVVAMPVSLRSEDNKDFSNQASMSLVDLGTHLANPAKRMAAIMASTAKVKAGLSQLKNVLPTDYPGLMAPWIVGTAAKAYSTPAVVNRLPAVANLVISNVPGPGVPLYMAGARMLTFHPLSIIVHGIALNITIQTYAGRVDFGVIADPNAVADLQEIATGLSDAFAQAQALFAAAQAPKATKTPPASKKTRVSVAVETKKPKAPSKAKTAGAATVAKRVVTPRPAQAR